MPEVPARIGLTIVLRRPERSIAAGASRKEVQQALSAEPADLETVRRFCESRNFQIDRESAPERSVRISGTASQIVAAFSSGVPTELKPAVIAVLGLDPGPVARPRVF